MMKKFERRTMMKKLLVLSLVLGIASLANAWLVTIDKTEALVGDTITMTIVAEQGDAQYKTVYAGVAETEADNAILSYAGAMVGADAPSLSQVTGEYNWGTDGFEGADLDANSGSVPQVFNPGTWFTVDFSADAVGLGNLYFYDYGTGEQADFAVNVVPVPEPATLALLGLGVLALRRKK